jgi:hypothetical protein
MHFSSIVELGNDQEGGCSSKETGKTGTNNTFLKAHAVYECFKSFFYAHRIGRCDEPNIFNMDFVVFHLKCKISN